MHFVSLILLTLLQGVCLYDALKKGYGFFFVLAILMFPLGGPIIYCCLEYMPRFQMKMERFKYARAHKKITLIESNLEYIKELARQNPSFENEFKLIKALHENKHHEQALQVLYRLQKGLFSDAPCLIKMRIKCYMALDAHENAYQWVKTGLNNEGLENDTEFTQLAGLVFDYHGHFQAALSLYQKSLEKGYDFSTHYHLIALLNRLNRKPEVEHEVNILIKRFHGLAKSQKRKNKKWVKQITQLH